ncbi:B-cell lymphoma/leukemia 11A-like [Mytilus edulis]|uniref:B-cell lymphoma/leukemia 11A-like n=1 Tax=Mytilus edulis TaxID=6550 RepID=UPI0039F14E72
MTLNINNPAPILVDGKVLPITETFTYQGSTIRNDGSAGSDIMNRLNKARNIFRSLNNVWKSSKYSVGNGLGMSSEEIEIPSLEQLYIGLQKEGVSEVDKKNTWRRTVEGELKTMNNTWGTVEKMTKDRQTWRTFVAALHADGIPGKPTKFEYKPYKATHESFLLQNAQREHGKKIYHTTPLIESLSVTRTIGAVMKALHDSKRSPQLSHPHKIHDDIRYQHLSIHRDHHRTSPSAGSSVGSGDATITSHHSLNPFMFRFPFDRPPLFPSLQFNRPPGPDFMSSEPRHLRLLNFPHFDGPSPPFPHLVDRTPCPMGFDNKTIESFYSQRLRKLASRDIITGTTSASSPIRKHTHPFSQASTTTTTLFSPLTPQQSSPHQVEPERAQRLDSLTPLSKLKSCEFCEKSFRFQSNLIVHRRSHTSEKPFKCPLCPHACTQQSKLKRHMKTHMNKSPMMSQISNSSDGGNHGSGDSTPEGSKKFMDDEDEDEEEEEEIEEEEEEMDESEEEEEMEEEEKDMDESEEEEEMEEEEEEIDESEMMEEKESRKLSNNNLKKKPDLFIPIFEPTHSRNGGFAINSNQDKSSLLKEMMENTGLTGIPTYKDALKQAIEENFSKENPESGKEQNDNGSRNCSISSKEDIKSEPETNQSNCIDKQANCEKRQGKHIQSEPHEAAPTPMFNFDMFSSLQQSLWRMPYANPQPEIYPHLIPGYPFDPNHNSGFNPVSTVESALKCNNTQKSVDNLSSANSSPLPRTESRRNDTCEYCGKIFRKCSNLTVHRRSHTGARPYKCALCSYSCARSNKLTRHMRTHGRIGKDVYRCKFCSMPFSVARTLEKHMRKCVVNGQMEMISDYDDLSHSSETARTIQDSESDSDNTSSNSPNTTTSIYKSNSLTRNAYGSPNSSASILDSMNSSKSSYASDSVASIMFDSAKVPTSLSDLAKMTGAIKKESGLFDSVNVTTNL